MKGLSRTTTIENFISQATNGEIKKEKIKKMNTNLSKVRFTDMQWKFIYKILEISNIRTKTALFSSIAEFMRSNFNCLDYIDYLDFITGVGVVKGTGKSYSIHKNKAYEFFNELYEDYRINWVNIRIRGVIILALLHYAKCKLNLNLDELLKGLSDE